MTIINLLPRAKESRETFASCNIYCPFRGKIIQCCHSEQSTFEDTRDMNCYYYDSKLNWEMLMPYGKNVVVFI